jgi:uncharacterized membrane protein YagU involved in acid resistance
MTTKNLTPKAALAENKPFFFISFSVTYCITFMLLLDPWIKICSWSGIPYLTPWVLVHDLYILYDHVDLN